MILITGGAWQGKREYAYGLMDTDSDKKLIIQGDRCSAEDMKRVQIVDQLHLWIRRKMEELMPQAGHQNLAGAMGSISDDGWDERVFDQQEMLLTQEKIWQELLEVVAENPDVIFIVNELGCGVIPMDVFDRRYREIVGRTCCDLAKEAKEVYRVVCGVGTVIKKAERDATEIVGTNTVTPSGSDDQSRQTESQVKDDQQAQTAQAGANDQQEQTGAQAAGEQQAQTDSENVAKEK